MRLISQISIFLLMWNFCLILCDLPDRQFIELYRMDCAMDLVHQETVYSRKLNYFYKLVWICSSNLKASKVSKNFTDALDDFAAKIQEMQTVKDQQNATLALTGLTDYSYAQYRISSLFSEEKNLRFVAENLRLNATKLYESSKVIIAQYVANFMTIRKLISKNRFVRTVMQYITKILLEVASYLQYLKTHIENHIKISSYLSTNIRSKAIPPDANLTLDEFMTKTKTIDSKLIPGQQQVITMSKVALNKCLEVPKTTSKIVQAGEGVSNLFKKIVKRLDKNIQMNDYSLLGWPIFPDPHNNMNSGMIQLRNGMCDMKKRDLDRIQKLVKINQTELRILRIAWNASFFIVKSARKVQTQSPAVLNCLTAIENVENSQTFYISKLEVAKVEVDTLKREVLIQLDEVESFESESCGIFAPYVDSMAGRQEVLKRGFIAGYDANNQPIYVGTVFNSHLNVSSFPARLVVSDSQLQAFFIGTDAEIESKSSIMYLQNHPKLEWNNDVVATVAENFYGIKLWAGNYPMLIGRIAESKVMQFVKVHGGNRIFGAFYYNSTLGQIAELDKWDPIEVLGCSGRLAYPCGTFKTYDSKWYSNWPSFQSKSIARSKEGFVDYLGRTRCPDSTLVASRVSVSPTKPGLYTACGDTSNGTEIYSNGPNLEYLMDTLKHSYVSVTMDDLGKLKATQKIVKFNNSKQMVGIGIKLFNDWTKSYVGSVIFEEGANKGLHYWDRDTLKYAILPANEQFDILVCDEETKVLD